MPSIYNTVLESVDGNLVSQAGQGYFSDHYVQIGAVKARYWDAGEQGTPILFLHGLGASIQLWRPVLEVLSHHQRVVAVDLPGFGLSDKPDIAYTPEFMVNFIRGFLEALGLQRVCLVAHSYGGAVALRIALENPERVERLALMAPASLGQDILPLFRWMSLPGLGGVLSLPSSPGTKMLFRMATYKHAKLSDKLIEESYQLSRLPGAQRGLLRSLRKIVNLFGQRSSFYSPIVERLHTLVMPTLLLWGKQDRIVPEMSNVARKIPGARIELWEACGHLPWIEYPEHFTSLLADFLDIKIA